MNIQRIGIAISAMSITSILILLAAYIITALPAGSENAQNAQPENTQAAQPESTFIHPHFTFTRESLTARVQNTLHILSAHILRSDREKIIGAIEQKPEVFLEYLSIMLQEPDQILFALVDKEHALPHDYEPPDLVELNEYPELELNKAGMQLRRKMMSPLIDMSESAREEGIVLRISSAYRAYTYQEGLFERHVSELGLQEAQRVSARAGTSQHQLGLAVDFGSITPQFADHPAGIWLAENGRNFGFSLSYPQNYEETTGYSYEPWHFRYLGKDVLNLQKEFFADIQQYLLLFYHQTYETLRESFSVAKRSPKCENAQQ